MVTIAKTKQPVRMPRFGHRVDKTDPILRGCVGWWPLNDGAGTKAVDLSANGNNATAGGTVAWESTSRGTAALFDGVGDGRFDIGTDLIGTGDYTISAWINVDAAASGTLYIYVTGGSDYREALYVNASVLGLDSYPATGTATTGTFSTFGQGWKHVLVTSSSGTITLYGGGSQVGTGTAETYTGATPTTYYIGYRRNGSEFNGNIQNFRIYNRALSASEVSRLYSEPWAGLEPLSPFSFFSGLSQIYAYYSAAFLQRLG